MKKIFAIILSIFMLSNIMLILGCDSPNPEDYTTEEHIARISERVEKKYMTDEYEHTSFTVYPLYNENDKVEMYLVEFEPFGFLFVKLGKEYRGFKGCLNKNTMYTVRTYFKETWSPYTVDQTIPLPNLNEDVFWILDENDQRIYYNKSPFSVMGKEGEKKYAFALLSEQYPANYVLAVKDGEEYINLVSSERFVLNDEYLTKVQPSLDVGIIFKSNGSNSI